MGNNRWNRGNCKDRTNTRFQCFKTVPFGRKLKVTNQGSIDKNSERPEESQPYDGVFRGWPSNWKKRAQITRGISCQSPGSERWLVTGTPRINQGKKPRKKNRPIVHKEKNQTPWKGSKQKQERLRKKSMYTARRKRETQRGWGWLRENGGNGLEQLRPACPPGERWGAEPGGGGKSNGQQWPISDKKKELWRRSSKEGTWSRHKL